MCHSRLRSHFHFMNVIGLSLLAAITASLAAFGASTPSPESVAPADLVKTLNSSACDLWDDDQEIPHVRADRPETLFACMGYLHGRDRAWQLDFFRRTAQGRRAEVFGKDHIRSDFQMRILDVPSKAQLLFETMPDRERRLWWAYAHGVNLGVTSALASGVFEFEHWGYSPEKWTPVDSLSLLLLQSFDQTRKTFAVQLEEARWLERHGTETPKLFLADEIEDGELPWDVSILKPGEFPKRSQENKETLNRTENPSSNSRQYASTALHEVLDGFSRIEVGAGSNNWVISPARSRTRKALLANDPHLGLGYPPLWHFSHVESPEYEAFGAAMPGIPVIVSGTNRHVAWGLTNSYLEVARITLVSEVELKNATEHRPWIWVKVWKFRVPYFFKTFRRTPAGFPVLPLEAPEGKAMVLTWTGFDLEPKDLQGLFSLMASRSASDTDAALSKVGVPSWNFVFADTRGNIGYRAVGRIPRASRAREAGIATEALNMLETTWRAKELLTTSEMPHALNPTRGFLVTANNRQWPKEAGLHGGWAYSPGYRAFRIEELLASSAEHDASSFSRIQCDVQSVGGRFLAPLLIARLERILPPDSLGEQERKALEVLRSWRMADYQATLECRACGIFRLWLNRVSSDLLLDDAALYRKLTSPAADRANFKELDPILTSAFRHATKQLWSAGLGTSGDFVSWGEIHRNSFPHLGDEALYADPGIPTPGDDTSVNPGTAKWEEDGFRHTTGASQRLIVELTDPPLVQSILPGPNRPSRDRNLHSSDSPWLQWRDCKVQKRHFPVNWEAVRSTRLSLGARGEH